MRLPSLDRRSDRRKRGGVGGSLGLDANGHRSKDRNQHQGSGYDQAEDDDPQHRGTAALPMSSIQGSTAITALTTIGTVMASSNGVRRRRRTSTVTVACRPET